MTSKRRVAALALTLTLAASALGPARQASAEGTKKETAAKRDAPKSLLQTLTGAAKADFEAAKLLANDGDFVGALIKFERAYDVSKDARVLWNVAFCQKNLRHYSKVTTTLKRYVEQGGALLSASDRKDAQDLISMIEPFTTRATFRVSQEGAQVYVDDELLGTSPLPAAIVLDIGERRLRVAKDGFVSYEKAFVVAGGPELTIDVALEREVHEGKLVVEAPGGATILLDDKPIGVGRVEQKVPSGGHQLRVVAPGMRPYQTEVIVQDRETRSLNVLLEAVAPSDKPMLRLAVGCADPEPRGPEDGLVVNLDGPEVLPPGPVKKRWSDQAGRNVVEYTEYPIAPGPHTIRVTITDCLPIDLSFDVDPVKGADVTGALESSRFILVRGPQGTPGSFRAGLGLWLAGGNISNATPESYGSSGLGLTGAAFDVGLLGRWFGVFLNGAYGSGSLARQTFNTHYALPNPAHTTWDRLLLRLGPRFPFNRVALGLGPVIGIEELDLDQVRTGKPGFTAGAFVEIDVQPLCDWGLFALADLESPASGTGGGGTGGLQFGFFYEPNARCRRERATAIGLRQPK